MHVDFSLLVDILFSYLILISHLMFRPTMHADFSLLVDIYLILLYIFSCRSVLRYRYLQARYSVHEMQNEMQNENEMSNEPLPTGDDL